MSAKNDLRPIGIKLGRSWKSAEQLMDFDFSVIPRTGELIDIMFDMDEPRSLRVLEVKHSLIDDLVMTELLVYPADALG